MARPSVSPSTPRVALVTGSSGTIGAATAVAMADLGYTVALHAHSDIAAAEDLRERLGGQSLVAKGDLTNADEAAAVVASAQAAGALEVVVNAAGMMKVGLLMAQPIDEWVRTVQLNLLGAYFICRAAVPGMLRRRSGRIVNIVSPAGMVGVPGQTAYSASKAGLIGLTRSLAVECARRNVTVNAVSPGFVDSKMTSELDPLQRDLIVGSVPLRRAANAAEIADAVRFVVQCAYMTGQVISVDGGITA